MRDYRFLRNMLYRHPGIDVDVWLQSADPSQAISQDSNQLLSQFPQTREEFFGTDTVPGYDVVIAFDPDWSQLSDENIDLLREWVLLTCWWINFLLLEMSTHPNSPAQKTK